jgi:hypothetical protein
VTDALPLKPSPYAKWSYVEAPGTYAKVARDQAPAVATARGEGLVMELGSSKTRYYSDPSIPVGRIVVYAPTRYKGTPLFVREIAGDEPWTPEYEAARVAWLEGRTQ